MSIHLTSKIIPIGILIFWAFCLGFIFGDYQAITLANIINFIIAAATASMAYTAWQAKNAWIQPRLIELSEKLDDERECIRELRIDDEALAKESLTSWLSNVDRVIAEIEINILEINKISSSLKFSKGLHVIKDLKESINDYVFEFDNIVSREAALKSFRDMRDFEDKNPHLVVDGYLPSDFLDQINDFERNEKIKRTIQIRMKQKVKKNDINHLLEMIEYEIRNLSAAARIMHSST